MKNTKRKQTTIKHLPLYLLTAAIAVLVKWFCKIEDCDAFIWILAPACSGIRFMLLTFLMLIFSFLHPDSALANEASMKKSYLWFGFSILFSYATTIFVNGIRINASIYLPVILENAGLIGGWLTQDRLHTTIGTITYFSFLCVLYPAAAFIYQRGFLKAQKKERCAPLSSLIPACFARRHSP